ncbi:MAG: hypothetical protein AAB428_01450, partial [Patescibacteria group bacterium]
IERLFGIGAGWKLFNKKPRAIRPIEKAPMVESLLRLAARERGLVGHPLVKTEEIAVFCKSANVKRMRKLAKLTQIKAWAELFSLRIHHD